MALQTVAQVAKRLAVTPRRVRYLITAKRLPAVRMGRDWLIDDGATISPRRAGPPPRRPRASLWRSA